MDLLAYTVLQQVNDQSGQQRKFSWCTHCFVWSRGALTVTGCGSKTGGVLGGVKMSLVVCILYGAVRQPLFLVILSLSIYLCTFVDRLCQCHYYHSPL